MIAVPGFERAIADARRTWVIGGSLLIAGAVVRLVFQGPTALPPGGDLIVDLLLPAALILFAVGIRGSGSVTALRPLGTGAMIGLALWVLVEPVVQRLFILPELESDAIYFVDAFVRFIAALTAAVQIARAGVVPRPWNWAPTWVVVALSVPWVLEEVIAVSPSPDLSALEAVITLDGLVRVGGAIFLGVLAIILANISGRTRTTPIPVDEVRD